MVFLVLLLAFCLGACSSSEVTDVENDAVDGYFQTKVFQLMTKFAGDMASLTEKFNSVSREMKTLKEEGLGNSKSVATNAKSLDSKVTRLQADSKNSAVEIGVLKTKVNYLEERLKETHMLPETLPAQLSDLEKNVSECYASVNSLHSQMAALPSALSGRTTKAVRFEVWVGSLDQRVVSNSVMKLRDIQQNLGGGYDAETGVFTAPVAGTYLFWVQVAKSRGPYLALHLIRDSTYIGYSIIEKKAYVTRSVVTAVPVDAGQRIFVRIFGAESLYCCYHTRFGGLLLF